MSDSELEGHVVVMIFLTSFFWKGGVDGVKSSVVSILLQRVDRIFDHVSSRLQLRGCGAYSV